MVIPPFVPIDIVNDTIYDVVLKLKYIDRIIYIPIVVLLLCYIMVLRMGSNMFAYAHCLY